MEDGLVLAELLTAMTEYVEQVLILVVMEDGLVLSTILSQS